MRSCSRGSAARSRVSRRRSRCSKRACRTMTTATDDEAAQESGRAQTRHAHRIGLVLTCVLAIAGFFAWSWPLAKSLTTHTLLPAGQQLTQPGAAPSGWGAIFEGDQDVTIWQAVQNARALAGLRLKSLLWQGQCYPMPAAA